jgi:hypothetical protein
MKSIEEVNEIVNQIVELDQEILKLDISLKESVRNRPDIGFEFGSLQSRTHRKLTRQHDSLNINFQKLRYKAISQLCRAGLCKSSEGLTSEEYHKICEVSLAVELSQGWHYVGNGDWC